MTRRDDIEAELADHTEYLRTPAPDSPAARLVRQQVQRHVDELVEKLKLLDSRPLIFHVTGDAAQRQSLHAPFFSQLLSRLQSMLTFATWAYDAGPGVQGNVPVRYERMSSTEVFALTPGSFEFGVRKADGDLDQAQWANLASLYDKAVGSLVDLTEAAAAHGMDEEQQEVVRTIGPEASRRLQLLMKKFAEEQATINLTLEAPDRRRRVTLEPADAKYLADWLSEYEAALDEMEVTGVLRVLDTVRGRFGIEDTTTGQLYEGKAPPALLSGANVEGGSYRARISVETHVAEHRGETSETLTLLGIEPIPSE
jgi:hypothetical protein